MMAKKGTEAIPWWDVDAGLQGFANICAKKNPVIPDKTDQTILHEIRRTVRELLHKDNTSGEYLSSLLPSMSAHVDWTRKEGGGTSALYETCAKHRTSNKVGDVEVKVPDHFELLRAAEGVTKSEFVPGKVHLVKEPFKLRSITTCPPNDAYLAKYLNRIIHSQVRKHPAFSFADHDVNLQDLEDFEFQNDEFAVSADYESATDNLKTRYTAWTWLCVCERLGFADWVFGWGLRTLTRNQWEMPNRKIIYQDETIQPMGNGLSFPLLCMINFSIVRHSCEVDRAEVIRDRLETTNRVCRKALPVRDIVDLSWVLSQKEVNARCQIKINGDDALFKLSRLSSYEYFKKISSSVGLIPSIGKNFISRDFGMINSKLLVIKRDCFVEGHFSYIAPYVNVGLMKGTGRVLSDTRIEESTHDAFYGSVGESSAALVKGFSLDDGDRLLTQFVRWNMDKLGKTWRDWYLPRSLGGLELVNLGLRSIPKLSKAAAVVAQYAFQELGLCIDSVPVELNATSKKYRRAVPMTSCRIDELPEEEIYDLRDDSYFFWTDEVDAAAGKRPGSEQQFRNAYSKALRKGVNPMVGRQKFRFRMEPLFQLVPVRQINVFIHNL
jgi:hypothetical protein